MDLYPQDLSAFDLIQLAADRSLMWGTDKMDQPYGDTAGFWVI